MAKWQLTLVQDGKVLRRYGGCSTDVEYELQCMLQNERKHLKSKSHYTILISRYTNLKQRKKKVVQMINIYTQPWAYASVWCINSAAPYCQKLLDYMIKHSTKEFR